MLGLSENGTITIIPERTNKIVVFYCKMSIKEVKLYFHLILKLRTDISGSKSPGQPKRTALLAPWRKQLTPVSL